MMPANHANAADRKKHASSDWPSSGPVYSLLNSLLGQQVNFYKIEQVIQARLQEFPDAGFLLPHSFYSIFGKYWADRPLNAFS